jgi:hypothetical protein
MRRILALPLIALLAIFAALLVVLFFVVAFLTEAVMGLWGSSEEPKPKAQHFYRPPTQTWPARVEARGDARFN